MFLKNGPWDGYNLWQDISTAGRQEGMEGVRSSLIKHLWRCWDEMDVKPKLYWKCHKMSQTWWNLFERLCIFASSSASCHQIVAHQEVRHFGKCCWAIGASYARCSDIHSRGATEYRPIDMMLFPFPSFQARKPASATCGWPGWVWLATCAARRCGPQEEIEFHLMHPAYELNWGQTRTHFLSDCAARLELLQGRVHQVI